MQEYRDESEIYDYPCIQLSNNKFINTILGGTFDLPWLYLNIYRISSNNNNRPLINYPPQIIHLTPLPNFSQIFYPLTVKLKWSLIQKDLTPRILTLKINWGTKFGTLKKLMLALFDVITFLFNGVIKQTF